MKILLFWLCTLLLSACARDTPTAQEQVARGEVLYNQFCTHCHEMENGIGPRLTREVLATRLTAASLNRYNQRNMPYEAGNTLLPEQYWEITAYLVQRHGFNPEGLYLGDGLELNLE